MLLQAMGSHGRFKRRSVQGSSVQGTQLGPASPHLPKAHTQLSSPLLVLTRLPQPTAWLENLAPASGQRAGPQSQEEKSRAHSQVPGQRAGSCVLAWPQVPHPQGLSSWRRNAVPSQGSQQELERGLKPTPATLGTVWLQAARPWEGFLRLPRPLGIWTPWVGPTTVAGGQWQEPTAETPSLAERVLCRYVFLLFT